MRMKRARPLAALGRNPRPPLRRDAWTSPGTLRRSSEDPSGVTGLHGSKMTDPKHDRPGKYSPRPDMDPITSRNIIRIAIRIIPS